MANYSERMLSLHTEGGLLAVLRVVAWMLKGTATAVNREDLVWQEGEWSIDGMNPYEWAEAMMQD